MVYKQGNHKKRKKIQVLMCVLISGLVILCSWTPFYEVAELKSLDLRFLLRGPIFFSPNIATIDIDNKALEEEPWRDWKRDKHARVIKMLKTLGARMIAMDFYFSEPSLSTINREKIEILGNTGSEEILSLFQDYDKELAQSIKEAENVYLAQTLKLSPNQNPDSIKKNTTIKHKNILKALEPYSLSYPEGWRTPIEKCIDIDQPPLERFIKVAKGVGFTQTFPDRDGIIRRYPLVLFYNGRLYPSLALIMVCDYLGISFHEIEIVPGQYISIPVRQFQGNDSLPFKIPIDKKGMMIVNWAGKWENTFSHISSAVLLSDKYLSFIWENRCLVGVKKIIYEHPELLQDYERFFKETDVLKFGNPDLIEDIYYLVLYASEFEKELTRNNNITVKDFFEIKGISFDQMPEEQIAFFSKIYNRIRCNIKVEKLLEENPYLPLDLIEEKLGRKLSNDIQNDIAVMRKLILKNGSVQPEDHPLYFLAVMMEDQVILPSDFENKVFFFGPTSFSIHDPNPIPFNSRYPMIGLHANVFNNIINRNFLVQYPKIINIFIIIICGILVLIVVRISKVLWRVLIVLSLIFIFMSVAFILFTNGIWIDVVGPVITLFLSYLSILVFNYVTDEREKQFIHGAFGQYLSPTVVDHLIQHPEMLNQLGGERRNMTVFFSDIAGFTSISEILSPDQLVILLNEYFEQMTDIIISYEGTVDKFEGDAIMAFYGAPIYFENHAEQACLACLDMQKELINMRKIWRNEGRPEIIARMGVNTGVMMVGNLGSLTRKDYSVIGDAVNLSSRLEGLNKFYGTNIMIGEKTYQEAKQAIEVRELDRVRVVGKEVPVKVYELICKKGEMSNFTSQIINLFTKGVACYRNRQWNEAIAFFNEVLKISAGDGPSKKYISRCEHFKKNPPPEDWDFVTDIETKG